MLIEKSFPRGGIPVKDSIPTVQKKENIIFGALQQKTQKKSKNKKTPNDTFEDPFEKDQQDVIEAHSADLLNYETIQDGMNIMGVVSSVDQLYVNVSLPGRMSARISALEISDAYTKAAREFLENTNEQLSSSYKTLQDLYHVGQIVYARVQDIKPRQYGAPELVMTLKPSEVHSELIHTNIRKGFIFNGAIEEIQEHGYIIESGIKGLRAFLPLEKAEIDLALGQLVFVKVDKVTINASASTCICKQLKPEQLKVKSKLSEPNIDYLLPTSIVSFRVTKCLKDGLQGSIMNEAFTGYVNEHQLSEPLNMPEDYEVGSDYEAHILYVMPLTKFVYLTLNLRRTSGGIGNEDEQPENDKGVGITGLYKRGDIIEKAKVHHLGTGGVVLVLNNQSKGIISYKTLKANYKGNYDQDELLSRYAKKTKHKVRILGYDMMDSLYICTDDTNIVNEKIFALDDLKAGDLTTAIVKKYNPKIDGYNLQCGKVQGIIERLYLGPGSSKQYELDAKLRCRVISVDEERKLVYLTNRLEYMAKNCTLLTSLSAAKKDAIFLGTIVKSTKEYYLVKFFNNISGLMYKNQLRQSFLNDQAESFTEGQTMHFRILNRKDEKITVTLGVGACELGEICTAKVSHILQTGYEVDIKRDGGENPEENDDEEGDHDINHGLVTKGLLPVHLFSDFTDLFKAKTRLYPVGSQFPVVSLHSNIFSLRDLSYFENYGSKDWKTVKTGDIIRAFVQNVNKDIIELLVPIRGYGKLVKVHLEMLLLHAYRKSNVVLNPEQVVYVRIAGKELATKTISVNAQLTSVWDQDLKSTAGYIESYQQEIENLREVLKEHGASISHYKVGDKVAVVFQGINSETKDWHYVEEKNKIPSRVVASLVADGKVKLPKVGAKQEAIVLWVDYGTDILFISTKPTDIKHIAQSSELPKDVASARKAEAKVLLKLETVFICSLKKGTNPLVYCPIRLHYNDFECSASADIEEGQFCKLVFIHKTKPIAVPQKTFDIWKKGIKRKALDIEENAKKIKKVTKEEEEQEEQTEEKKKEKMKKVKKEKLEEVKEEEEQTKTKKSLLKKTSSESLPVEISTTKKSKKAVKDTKTPVTESLPMEISETKKENKIQKKDQNAIAPNALFFVDTKPGIPPAEAVKENPSNAKSNTKTLSGIGDFWTTDLSQLAEKAESSDEDDDMEEQAATDKQKKKKLTSVEKFKQQRAEEARLREIEEQYADPNHAPETVDQFDRLVLCDPNSSKNWISYMVFHLQSAEIEKARAVAQRALKAITMRNSEDHLNIWVARLNLEIRYGSRDTFDSTLKEALTYNEPIKVYLRVVEILKEAKKNQELIEIVSLMTKKFKGVQDVWKAAADAYFSIKLVDQAQQLMHKALASLPDREHVNTIVMFANLNHRHGCNEMAQTLLDQVVTSYPKRVDVWTQYVDMLVKDQLIDSARSVLDRAILEKIPLKKMRTIFKKYLEFEEHHGTEADVEKVKRLAAEYVKNNANV